MVKIEFIKSAVFESDYPQSNLKEVAIAGRSNAGKSSFLNALCGSQKMAKVSSTPGKTRLLNFFSVNKKYNLVDMPGYGFASRSGSEVEDWQGMIEHYIVSRSQLCGLLLVMDIRRDWSEDEELLRRWVQNQNLPMALVLTKADKLNRSELQKALARLQRDSTVAPLFTTSALEKAGQSAVEDYVYKNWVGQ